MDDYPEHLSPGFEDSGLKKTTFEDWWPRVRSEFPTVPEEVARYWLYEHWSNSPYRYLVSRSYLFSREQWAPARLSDIRSIWCGYDPTNEGCLRHGKHLVEKDLVPGTRYKTAVYMREHGDFPTPIIVLDNRDGFVKPKPGQHKSLAIPPALVLTEGHRRFNIALYLQSKGLLRPEVGIWLMTRVTDK